MKPFLSGKKTLFGEPLRSAQPHAHPSQPGNAHPGPAGPTVETVKQGDKVVRLIVSCSCGERIEIDCLYPAGS